MGRDRPGVGRRMLQNFADYGYLGVFLALVASGLGLPIPEEIPVVMAGAMVGHEDTPLKWYVMLPVVMAGVVIGDGFLYGMGRVWGTRFLSLGWVQRRLVTPEKRAEIEKNFHDRGIAVLLGARLLPGIRTPIFIMAGVLRVPFTRFLLADGLYAIPGVNLLFWLAYLLTDQMIRVVNKLEEYRPLVMVSILSAVAGALFQKYVLTRKVSTGEPPHVPPMIAKPAGAVAHAVEVAVEKAVGAAGAVAHAAHIGRSAERKLEPGEVVPGANGAATPAGPAPKPGTPPPVEAP